MGQLFGSPEAFFEAIAAYNVVIWPVQIVTYLLGTAAVILTIWRMKHSDRIVSLILAFLWLWSGVVCCLVFLAKVHLSFFLMGILLTVEGLLLLMFGWGVGVKRSLSFRFRESSYSATGMIMILYAWVIYPLIGHLTGHAYPSHPVFGVAPCPVTIFTFGLLLLTHTRVPGVILIIPLIGSLVGILAVWAYGIYADIGLVASGIAGTILILYRNRVRSRSGNTGKAERSGRS